MKNRIILGVTALLAFAMLAETAQAQWGRRGGGWGGNSWRGGNSVYVGTPYFSVGYGRGYYGGYGGYYGGNWPGSYGYGYSSYPNYGYSYSSPYYGYSYSPSYAYSYYPSSDYSSYPSNYSYSSSPMYMYSGDSGITQASYMPDPSTIVLRVNVPDANANIWIENVQMSLQGFERTFVSPPVTTGKGYTYTVRASWMENGKEMSKEKTIDVQAGQEYTVSFAANDASAPNRTANEPEKFPTPGRSDQYDGVSGSRDNRSSGDNRAAGSNENTHEGLIVQAGNGSLVMTDMQGNGRHSHVIAADATITRDGKDAKLEDLHEGDRVRVTAKPDGARTVTKIEAESKANNNKPQRDRVP